MTLTIIPDPYVNSESFCLIPVNKTVLPKCFSRPFRVAGRFAIGTVRPIQSLGLAVHILLVYRQLASERCVFYLVRARMRCFPYSGGFLWAIGYAPYTAKFLSNFNQSANKTGKATSYIGLCYGMGYRYLKLC